MKQRGAEPLTFDSGDGTYSTARQPNGDCYFLTPENLCTIHRDVEYKAKPLACRQFPFRIRRTPDGVVVGLSFYCPSVMTDTGDPVERYEPEIRSWLDAHSYGSVGDGPMPFDESIQIDWKGYRILEGFVRHCLFHGDDVPQALWEAEKALLLISILSVPKNVTAKGQPGITVLEAPRLEKSLTEASVFDFGNAQVFPQLSLFFAFTVVGVLESKGPDEARAATEAAMSGGAFHSLHFSRTVDLAGFGAYYQANPCQWKSVMMRKYLDHLVFRTFLVESEPVLHRMTALYMAASLLDFYLYLSAWQAGRPAPGEEDMRCALGIVEKGFAGHTRTLVPFFKGFTDGFRRQMKEML